MTTDRPSPEQQLTEVIAREAGPCNDDANHDGRQWLWAAEAIIAAVNTGDIDPIVPDGKIVIDTPRYPHGGWCRCSSCITTP